MMLGAIEMEKGPYRGDLSKARRHFEQRLGLAEAQAPTDPKAAELALEDPGGPDRPGGPRLQARWACPSAPFPPAAGAPPRPTRRPSPALLDMFESMGGAAGIDLDDLFDDEFDDDDDDEFDDGPPPPLPGPRPRRNAPKKNGRRSGSHP